MLLIHGVLVCHHSMSCQVSRSEEQVYPARGAPVRQLLNHENVGCQARYNVLESNCMMLEIKAYDSSNQYFTPWFILLF